ncbi:MAG TPA: hypothetical protein VH796_02505 [Nitrososphaeraceae archaeon]|jgi:hypothetical protein
MEKTLFEVDECLTDQCNFCTGYYKNQIFSSTIICKCKCHIIKESNTQQISTKIKARPGQSKSKSSAENQGVKTVLEVWGPNSNTTLSAPDP